MKNFLIILIFCLTAISCTKSNENVQPKQEVEARRKPGHGGGSDQPPNNVPQVTGVTATALSSTEVALSWNSVPGATAYWIYRGSVVPAIVSGTSYADRYVSPGTAYTYAVAAVVNNTLGPKSSSVTVTTPR